MTLTRILQVDNVNHLRRVYKSLGRAELQTGLEDDDLLLSELFKTDDLILGFYTEEGLQVAMERYGVHDLVRERGYEDVDVSAGPHANGYQLSVRGDGEKLVHVVVDRAALDLTNVTTPSPGFVAPEVLYIHWIQLQNPRAKFSKNRLPLPAQEHPGLGVGRMVFELLANVARRLGLQGLSAVPMEFHNAYFYDLGFEYADPSVQGRFEAMVRDGVEFYQSVYGFPKTTAVCATSWAFEFDLVTDEEGKPVPWFTEPMVSPVSSELRNYLGSNWFRQALEDEWEEATFIFPGEALFRKLDDAGIRPLDLEKFAKWDREKSI